MERILDENEKLRRAEQIYFKRNNREINLSNEKVHKEKRYLGSKLLLELLVLFNIAIIIFCIQNKNSIFTEEFLNKCSEYNINISKNINSLIEKFLTEDAIKNGEENTNSCAENVILNNSEKQNEEKKNESENFVLNNNEKEQNGEKQIANTAESSISEMDIDVQNLKSIYRFVKPLDAIISSNFGDRESKYQNVSGYHKGIDLAAEKGTPIKAAMEGIVTLVSSEGDYGKHLKIRCNNVTTVYAHCSKILVKEGQIVALGQEIAKVGSTGNSTGNHLHFEIRIDDRLVDPGKVIDF